MFEAIRKLGPCLALTCALAAPAVADTEFRVRRMTRNDVPLGKGQCDIRLQVDNEVEVSVRGDMVHIRTISGRDARDDGSECNEPLPARNLQGFGYEVRDSRGEIRMLSEPSPRSGYAAVVRIRDNSGGEGRYHFRLTWEVGGGAGWNDGNRGRPDFDRGRLDGDRYGSRGGWNDMINFRGRGRGSYSRRGEPTRNIYEVSVTVERDGRVVAVFNTDGGPPLAFSGSVTNWQAGTLTADLYSGDRTRGLRGSALISLDGRRQVDRVSMDGTADRDRFRLDWSRR